MKRVTWIILGMCLLSISQVSNGESNMVSHKKLTPTFEVRDVLDTGTLILKNRTVVKLAGIHGNSSREAISFVKEVISKKRIALVSDTNTKEKAYYVYVLGLDVEKLPYKLKNYAPEARGFLDLKVKFDVKKGILYNLNTILLRSGYAEVDKSHPFEYLSYFEKCEEEAKINRRGIWKRTK